VCIYASTPPLLQNKAITNTDENYFKAQRIELVAFLKNTHTHTKSTKKQPSKQTKKTKKPTNNDY
jgi:hypothetical protein